jgi:hypothetical protein
MAEPESVEMIELTEEQRRDLNGGGPPRVLDPATRQTYVLIREEEYDRIRKLFDEEFRPSDAYAALDRAFADGWNAPGMDDYDRYEELKK